jgi:hypothetical protein
LTKSSVFLLAICSVLTIGSFFWSNKLSSSRGRKNHFSFHAEPKS